MHKATTGRSAKRKGKEYELKIARLLRSSGLDKEARRSFQSGANWSWKSDIYTSLDFAIEIKKQEKVSIWQWWEQAETQRKPYKPPVLIFSSDFRPDLVVMNLNDWINLIKERNEWREKAKLQAS